MTTSNKLLFAVIILLLLVILSIYFVWQIRGSFTVVRPTVSPTPGLTANPAGANTYSSERLGIEFKYTPKIQDGPEVKVTEDGDRIYIHFANAKPDTGQFIEVFSKNSNESLEASIRRQILAGFPSGDCKINVTPSNIQAGFQVAEITYPRPTNTEEPFFANAKLCNQDYDQTNGMRYFLYDPNFPEKFAFLDIGQYAIAGAGEIPWQYTVKFIND